MVARKVSLTSGAVVAKPPESGHRRARAVMVSLMIEFEVREERQGDADPIRALVTAAFGRDGDTAGFVEAVRVKASVCLAEVAVIAGGKLVGHA